MPVWGLEDERMDRDFIKAVGLQKISNYNSKSTQILQTQTGPTGRPDRSYWSGRPRLVQKLAVKQCVKRLQLSDSVG